MDRIRRPALILSALAVSALVFAGCTANGGGWIPGQNAKKATFGFTWQADEYFPYVYPTLAKGSWSDGYVKFRIADGGVTSFSFSGDCLSGDGQYVSTNRNYPGGGDIHIDLCDYGEPGPTVGDSVAVNLSGPPYSYSNSGTLQGGNLKFKSDEN